MFLKVDISERGFIALAIGCLAGEQQVPHRAFSPIRNDKINLIKLSLRLVDV
jgi:hypothetical protein